MTRKCEACGLLVPDSTERCECGHRVGARAEHKRPARTTTWSGWGGQIARIVIAVIAFALASWLSRSTFRGCTSGRSHPLRAVPGLDTASADRIESVMNAEMAPINRNPRYLRRLEEVTRRESSADAKSRAARELGAELSSRGLARLPFGELREWNRLRLALTRSESLCSSFWRGGATSRDLFLQLAAFSDADLHSWFRVLFLAGQLELDARDAVAIDQNALTEGFVAIRDSLPEHDAELMQRVLEAGPNASTSDSCRVARWTHEGASRLPAGLQERFLRALAASSSVR